MYNFRTTYYSVLKYNVDLFYQEVGLEQNYLFCRKGTFFINFHTLYKGETHELNKNIEGKYNFGKINLHHGYTQYAIKTRLFVITDIYL